MTAFESISNLIEQNKSFVLEAGAGSGKTYTLIQTINYLIEKKGAALKLKNQKVVCITYTNVAKNEIIERLEHNPMVLVSTIHEFLWECIKPFNKQLILEFDALNTIMHQEKPEKYQLNLKDRITRVEYNDRAYSDFEDGKIGHDDLIVVSKNMFQNYKLLTTILADKYPYILVDEYQDTAVETTEALINSLLSREKAKVLLGFYGDSYQKIYDTGVGSLETFIHEGKINLVTKKENYRSSTNVINLLNKVRTNIKQEIPDSTDKIDGSVMFINCDNYPAPPKKGIMEYEKSIVPQKNLNYEKIKTKLEAEGWVFTDNSEDKILIIANSRVAERAGFSNLYKVYSTRFGEGANEALIKRENYFTSFFLGSLDKKTSKERESGVEHLIAFYQSQDYNSVMRFLRKGNSDQGVSGYLKKHEDKTAITNKLLELIEIRNSKTIGDVFNYVTENELMTIPKSIGKYLEKIAVNPDDLADEDLKTKLQKDIAYHKSLMLLPYIEVINLFKHTQNQTVFSTKHGTKGEEYRNVLVVIDDTSWKGKYNFQNFIDNSDDKPDRLLRTKNLFYVSCSRAKENLVVLSLSTMQKGAMNEIDNWFGGGTIASIADI
ncbi:MAG: ATP-dependent helicase [Chitinophagaceae bacterium]|nr:ATP-dependent helicase [Chitinophagaceae bacterium]